MSYSEYITKGVVTGIMVVLTYFFWGTRYDTRGLNPILPIGVLLDVPLIFNTFFTKYINHLGDKI